MYTYIPLIIYIYIYIYIYICMYVCIYVYNTIRIQKSVTCLNKIELV